jgi:hypothetical protein
MFANGDALLLGFLGAVATAAMATTWFVGRIL